MRAYVGVTDGDWFDLLASRRGLEEVNFWKPSGGTFKALDPGELFLFKLHSPRNFIVGGGVFAHFTLLPMSLAWESFGEANGAQTLREMRARIEHYRNRPPDRFEDYVIGCVLLQQPFFLPEKDWIPVPRDWKPNIVAGRGYDLEQEPGLSLWRALDAKLAAQRMAEADQVAETSARFGTPLMVLPRLGQGTFRVLVTDAYGRRCSVSRERTLPVLQAAHVRPYTRGREHRLDNGLLLRSDLHTLFDRGYVTVTPDHKFEVSHRIREEFENGRDYYALHGRELHLPEETWKRPAASVLTWHNENVYRG